MINPGTPYVCQASFHALIAAGVSGSSRYRWRQRLQCSALDETVNNLYKTELVRGRRPGLDDRSRDSDARPAGLMEQRPSPTKLPATASQAKSEPSSTRSMHHGGRTSGRLTTEPNKKQITSDHVQAMNRGPVTKLQDTILRPEAPCGILRYVLPSVASGAERIHFRDREGRDCSLNQDCCAEVLIAFRHI